MWQTMLVDNQNSLHGPAHTHLGELFPHSLEPFCYRTVLLVQGFFSAKCVVGQGIPTVPNIAKLIWCWLVLRLGQILFAIYRPRPGLSQDFKNVCHINELPTFRPLNDRPLIERLFDRPASIFFLFQVAINYIFYSIPFIEYIST